MPWRVRGLLVCVGIMLVAGALPAQTPALVPPDHPSAGGAPPGQAEVAAASGFPVGVGQSFRDCAGCPEMVVIPAGRFLMGSPQDETGRERREDPQREMALLRPLAVSKFEVTFAAWDACVSAGGCRRRPPDHGWGRGTQPVMDVGWLDAARYTQWLSARTQRDYRLLTEAEWEYAARAGSVDAYSFGETISPSQANFAFNAGRALPVGSFPPNAFGLHDMHGNVGEWTLDCFYGYDPHVTDASLRIETGPCLAMVVRGGGYDQSAVALRSAARGGMVLDGRSRGVGLRIARLPQ